MNAWAIIPARGGSKGIPRKNIRALAGKPLIAWSIEAARAAASVDRVVVSTDDPEIAKVAERWGGEAIIRPAEISGDASPSEEALLHALTHLRESESALPDVFAFLQCTAPLLLPEDIEGTVELVRSGRYDSAFAATAFHGFVWTVSGEGSMQGVNHDASVRPMRQERREEFLEAGSVYAMKTHEFLRCRHRFFGRVGVHVIPRARYKDIDDLDDWAMAEAILKRKDGEP